MNINVVVPQLARCGTVIALHCSGADASEWRCLSEALDGECAVLAPEHYGSESSGPWTGEHAFTLADEAAKSLALIDENRNEVHLVGHSYGGAVALHLALSRPERIASLSLYEPTSFHLLRQMGQPGAPAFAEISGISRRVNAFVAAGDYRSAIADFVDYWSTEGVWDAMRPSAQSALIRWAPTAPLEFSALLGDQTPASAYRTINVPVLILRGENAPLSTRVISERLIELLPRSRLKIVAGAGHMGPLTHASNVSRLIVQHIATVDSRRW
jgi:pimeloyl-ACP methyl ester carboxylesterase